MLLAHLVDRLERSSWRRGQRARTVRRGRARQLVLEALEDRCLLSLQLAIDDLDTTGVDRTIVDNAAGDLSPLAGVVVAVGGVRNFPIVVATAVVNPLVGDMLKALIHMSAVVVGAGRITITATNIDYKLASQPGPHVLTSLIGGVTGGTVTFINKVDLSNTVPPAKIVTTVSHFPKSLPKSGVQSVEE